MNDLPLIMSIVVSVLGYMNLVFLLALLLKRNDIVDIGWGLGFVLISALTAIFQSVSGVRALVLNLLVVIWGLRLAVFLFFRNKGRKEDFRYAQWRKDWGKNWVLRSYLQVFLLQGFFMLAIAYPIFVFRHNEVPALDGRGVLGIGVWLIGFFFEAVGDQQLLLFKRNPTNKGRIMNRGLWRFTRHPNYFGEVAMWWGIYLLALGSPGAGWGIFSPLVITGLLLKVSGLPMLEKKYQTNQEYIRYIQSTSSFFPLPPRKTK